MLLAAYAPGLAVPLFLLAALWDRLDLGRCRWLRPRTWAVGPLRVHPFSALAGLLLVGVGAVFLRHDGTAGVVAGLGVPDLSNAEYVAQEAVGAWAATVPSWVLPAVVLVVAWAVAFVRRRADG